MAVQYQMYAVFSWSLAASISIKYYSHMVTNTKFSPTDGLPDDIFLPIVLREHGAPLKIIYTKLHVL